MKGTWELEFFSSKKEVLLSNSRYLSPLIGAIISWSNRRRWEESFEESKGKDLSEIFEICIVNTEVLSTEEGSLLVVAKYFSGFMEEDDAESFLNVVNISFNFSFLFLEEVLMTSSRKEEALRSSPKIVPSVWGMTTGSNYMSMLMSSTSLSQK